MNATPASRKRTFIALGILAVVLLGLVLVLRPWASGEDAAPPPEVAERAQEIENQVGSVQSIPEPHNARTAPATRTAQPVGGN